MPRPPLRPHRRPGDRRSSVQSQGPHHGAVAKILSREFEDISISKIRYLEDQKLLSPRRTPGGNRLYSQAVRWQRLRLILRMQRDEFLPLRVIRQELAAGAREERTGAALRRAGHGRGRQGLATFPRGTGGRDGRRPRPGQGLEDWRLVQPSRSRARSSTTTPTARSCRRARSSPASASEAATSRSSGRRRTARHSFWSRVGAALRSTNHNTRREAMEKPGEPRRGCNNLTHMLARPRSAEADRRGVKPAPWHASSAGAASQRPRARSGAVVTDPYHLPRWWPNTQRVENVSEGDPADRSWTQVLVTRDGRGVRADYHWRRGD